jgi:hypothetical protein
MSRPYRMHAGRQGIVSPRHGGVHFVLSPGQLQLLRALTRGEALPIRRASRAIYPEQAGPLTPSQRAAAARSVTRLVNHGLVERRGAALTVTTNGALTRLVADMVEL